MEISFYNEFKRKAIHLVALVIPMGYFFLPKPLSLFILTPFALGSIVIDMIRLKRLPLHGFLNRVIGPMLREHENADFTGSSYILTASVLSILLFDKIAAVAAISFIILGDIAAALIGRRYGKIRIRSKSLEGSLACLTMCLLVAVIVPGFPLWIGVVGAFAATLVEGITLPIDDNFSVPLISGLVMHILLRI
ncbi:MAG: diacylglycerol/polyprenol kinase family protein [Candidatus Zixiibacteriota bacterium]